MHTSPQSYEESRNVSQNSVDSDSDPEPNQPSVASQLKPLPKSAPLQVETVKSTDSEVVSDDTVSGPKGSKGKKTVAIDISQNEHFSHRLMPVRSPEFDNVIDQVQLLVLNSCM